ncbi:hypothetical protein JV33_21445 [Pectobacterium carotovorum subsp. carotovorum]|nr:hypothetical protein JV33_21445 [Pectobacterium carotovorum subsp. carotovorum]KML64956.1 hypothetical protein G032_21070 [Pectobacterium carotovorum subsp. carotovorum ICMP 5702]
MAGKPVMAWQDGGRGVGVWRIVPPWGGFRRINADDPLVSCVPPFMRYAHRKIQKREMLTHGEIP